MLNGIICVNKPEGFTSFDVIAKLRGILKMKKLGHSGTLDPMATGVLPVFAGSATKAISILPDTDKSYLAGFKLGIVTDTEDITGKILKEYPVSVSKEEIEKIISIKSDEIQDNNNNDSTIYVVFTEKNKVVYQLFGDAQNLGFSFDLGKYKKFKRITCDNCDFSVQNKNGENIHKLIEK